MLRRMNSSSTLDVKLPRKFGFLSFSAIWSFIQLHIACESMLYRWTLARLHGINFAEFSLSNLQLLIASTTTSNTRRALSILLWIPAENPK